MNDIDSYWYHYAGTRDIPDAVFNPPIRDQVTLGFTCTRTANMSMHESTVFLKEDLFYIKDVCHSVACDLNTCLLSLISGYQKRKQYAHGDNLG